MCRAQYSNFRVFEFVYHVITIRNVWALRIYCVIKLRAVFASWTACAQVQPLECSKWSPLGEVVVDHSDHNVLRTPSGENVEVPGECLLSEFGIRSNSFVHAEESRGEKLNAWTRADHGARFGVFAWASPWRWECRAVWTFLAVAEQAAGMVCSRWRRRT